MKITQENIETIAPGILAQANGTLDDRRPLQALLTAMGIKWSDNVMSRFIEVSEINGDTHTIFATTAESAVRSLARSQPWTDDQQRQYTADGNLFTVVAYVDIEIKGTEPC